jgi:hypothetical protein
LNSDGAVDPSFRADARSYGGIGRFLIGVVSAAVQPDGKILIAGTFTEVNGVRQRFVARLHPDGSLDQNFMIGSGPGDGGVDKLLLQPDGQVLVAGWFRKFDFLPRRNLVRLNGAPPITAPVITAQPVGQTNFVARIVTFRVTATGAPPPSYQWQKDGVVLPGATNCDADRD